MSDEFPRISPEEFEETRKRIEKIIQQSSEVNLSDIRSSNRKKKDPPPTIEESLKSRDSLRDYSAELAKLRFEDHKYDAQLKKDLGSSVIALFQWQMFLMNLGFFTYAAIQVISRHQSLPENVIIAWLTTSIVQVVGLATVVAKYLFPAEGSNWAKEPNN